MLSDEQRGVRMHRIVAKLCKEANSRRRVLAEPFLCFKLRSRSRDVIVKANAVEVSKTLHPYAQQLDTGKVVFSVT